jgi:hypothetical protein
MIRLELSLADAQVLRSTLENYLSDLRMEIAGTDSQDFRDMLKERKAALQRISEQLGES